MAGRKKVEGAPLSTRTLQRRAKEAADVKSPAAPTAASVKAKPKRKSAPRIKNPIDKWAAARVELRSPELKALDDKLLSRMTALADTLPPTMEALQSLINMRGSMSLSF